MSEGAEIHLESQATDESIKILDSQSPKEQVDNASGSVEENAPTRTDPVVALEQIDDPHLDMPRKIEDVATANIVDCNDKELVQQSLGSQKEIMLAESLKNDISPEEPKQSEQNTDESSVSGLTTPKMAALEEQGAVNASSVHADETSAVPQVQDTGPGAEIRVQSPSKDQVLLKSSIETGVDQAQQESATKTKSPRPKRQRKKPVALTFGQEEPMPPKISINIEGDASLKPNSAIDQSKPKKTRKRAAPKQAPSKKLAFVSTTLFSYGYTSATVSMPTIDIAPAAQNPRKDPGQAPSADASTGGEPMVKKARKRTPKKKPEASDPGIEQSGQSIAVSAAQSDSTSQAQAVLTSIDGNITSEEKPKRKRGPRKKKEAINGELGANLEESKQIEGTAQTVIDANTAEHTEKATADVVLVENMTVPVVTADGTVLSEEKPKRKRGPRKKKEITSPEEVGQALLDGPTQANSMKSTVPDVQLIEKPIVYLVAPDGSITVQEKPKRKRTPRKKKDSLPTEGDSVSEGKQGTTGTEQAVDSAQASAAQPEKPKRARKKTIKLQDGKIQLSEVPVGDEAQNATSTLTESSTLESLGQPAISGEAPKPKRQRKTRAPKSVDETAQTKLSFVSKPTDSADVVSIENPPPKAIKKPVEPKLIPTNLPQSLRVMSEGGFFPDEFAERPKVDFKEPAKAPAMQKIRINGLELYKGLRAIQSRIEALLEKVPPEERAASEPDNIDAMTAVEYLRDLMHRFETRDFGDSLNFLSERFRWIGKLYWVAGERPNARKRWYHIMCNLPEALPMEDLQAFYGECRRLAAKGDGEKAPADAPEAMDLQDDGPIDGVDAGQNIESAQKATEVAREDIVAE